MDLQKIFNDLVRFETEIWHAIDVRLTAELGLPMSRFEPMQVIARTQACRVHDIARELSLTPGGTSKLVDRLEAAGLCERHSNPNDRRSAVISLTDVGENLRRRANAAFEEELQDRLGSALPPGGLEQFAAMLTALRSRHAGQSLTHEAS
jgi:DNA-binding MarR family transcriptional regulator